MKIIDYGFFTVKEPEPGNRVLLFTNEDGKDWYDLRRDLTEWDAKGVFISAIFPAWAMVDAEGVVTNVEYDPSRLMPGDRRVLGIDAPIKDIKPGMVYRDGGLHEHSAA
jgi:hypothetical protein